MKKKKKSSQSFFSYFLNAARSAGATLPLRLLWAVVLAGVAACVVLVLPSVAPSAAGRFPEYFFSSSFGAAYVFTVLVSGLMMLARVFSPKLFIFDEILTGKWELASRCGSDLRTRCLAKALFAFWAPATTYCIAAVLFSLILNLLGGSDFSGFGSCMRVFLIGLLSMIALFSLEIIFAALGVQKSALPFVCLPFFILVLVLWYWKGFFRTGAMENLSSAVDSLLAFSPVSLLIPALLLFVLALVICMLVPVKRIDRYVIEDLDDEMLRVLEFREDQEVYEKTGEGFELVFTGKEVLRSR